MTSNLSRYSTNPPHRGSTKRRSEVASYPLRAVVDEHFPKLMTLLGREVCVEMVLLECGHTLARAADFIGERHPARRRCHKCAKGKPPDFLPPTLSEPEDVVP